MKWLSGVRIVGILSLLATIMAASTPAFLANLHASRFAEAIDGVTTIAEHAVQYSEGKELPASFPAPVGLTPKEIPRGQPVVDPPGTWDAPTWTSLGFKIDTAHWYSYEFDVSADPNRIWFAARAKGDLNGDGVPSLFEVTGERKAGEKALIVPGMTIHREVE